ncbi:MAG TPA: hypothetical protein VMS88_07730 [Terriglobales bacterium]|nr:hypothetical protein [Terriglobales bacterium]
MRKNRFSIIAAGALLLVSGIEARAEPRPALAGLSAVRVSAEVSPANLSPQAAPDSLRARTERRLGAAGIRVLTGAPNDSEAVLDVRITFVRLTAAPLSGDLVGYGFAVVVRLSRQVRTIATPATPSRAVPASLWESWSVADADPNLSPAQAMRAADAKVEEFVKDWAATRGGGAR